VNAHCPPAEQLERLLDDRLETIEDSTLAQHVESCQECQARLERLLRKEEGGRRNKAKAALINPSSFLLPPLSPRRPTPCCFG
jgi:anti-sigma factor RsiW